MLTPKYDRFNHSGIITDLPPEQVNPDSWTSGSNVFFLENATKRVGGVTEFATPVEPPIYVANITLPLISYWVYCTPTRIFVTNGVDHDDITPLAGLSPTAPGDWTHTILNNVLVLNNAVDAPIYWSGSVSSPCEILPGWPETARCKAIRAFKYHLIALNITENSVAFPDLLWWSEGAEPGTLPQEWLPSSTNDAGDVIMADTNGDIVDGLSLRDAFIVYKDYSSYMLQYVAGQLTFASRKLFYSSGIQSRNCIAELDGYHWVFTGTDVIRHDGQTAQSVVDNKSRRAIVESVDPNYRQLCQVLIRHARNQVWIAVPEQGQISLSRAWLINTLTGDIGARELVNIAHIGRGVVTGDPLGMSWDGDDEAWNNDPSVWNQQAFSATEDSFLMANQVDQQLLDVDRDNALLGEPIYAFVERTGLPLGDPVSRKMITRIIPRLEGTSGEVITVRVGSQAFFNEPVAWSDPVEFVIGEDVQAAFILEARLTSVRFEATGTTQWTLHGYTIEWVEQGIY